MHAVDHRRQPRHAAPGGVPPRMRRRPDAARPWPLPPVRTRGKPRGPPLALEWVELLLKAEEAAGVDVEHRRGLVVCARLLERGAPRRARPRARRAVPGLPGCQRRWQRRESAIWGCSRARHCAILDWRRPGRTGFTVRRARGCVVRGSRKSSASGTGTAVKTLRLWSSASRGMRRAWRSLG